MSIAFLSYMRPMYVVPALRCVMGMRAGAGHVFSYKNLASVAQGQTDFTAYKQAHILQELAFSIISLAVDLEISSEISTVSRIAVMASSYAIPLALQVLQHYCEDDPEIDKRLKNVIKGVRSYLQHVAFSIDIIVNALFAYYVAPTYGVGVLTGMALEYFSQMPATSSSLREVWEKTFLGLAYVKILNLSYIKRTRVWDVLRPVLETSLMIWEHYFSYEKLTVASSDHAVSPDQVADILEKDVFCFVTTYKHLETSPLPPLSKECLTISFENLLSDVCETASSNGLKYDRNSLNILHMYCAQETTVFGDAYVHKNELVKCLKGILYSFYQKKWESDDIADFSNLCNLGDPCMNGKSYALYSLYAKRCSLNSPSKMLLLEASKVRARWFDAIYARFASFSYSLPRGVFDPSDIHFYNMALFYPEKAWKLHSDSIKNDINILETDFCSRLLRVFIDKVTNVTFWPYALKSHQWYSPQALIHQLKSSAEPITSSQVTSFLKSWCESQTNKDDLLDSLSYDDVFYDINLSCLEGLQDKSKPQEDIDRLLIFMLCDAGIISLVESKK